ncbi:MAG: hypothetical protein NTZ74_13090 [Chloroflexi bacterium]|nr:hypothetical protein [Chloroflexota bacterium]
MKNGFLYVMLVVTMLLSACSGLNDSLNQLIDQNNEPTAETTIETIVAPTQDVTVAEQSTPVSATENGQPGGGGTPPQEAITACVNKIESDTCEFTSNKGTETGVCETVQTQLACSPKKDGGSNVGPSDESSNPQSGNQLDANGSAYNINQAVSDKAQGMTIDFDAMAFLTGNLGADSFFPPGKVADFWGFQYLRDNDPSQMGHAGDFLTSAAMNMLNVLTADQRAQLVALAVNQVDMIDEYGYKRFVLMDAFQNYLDGNLPTGTSTLNADAIKTYSAELCSGR